MVSRVSVSVESSLHGPFAADHPVVVDERKFPLRGDVACDRVDGAIDLLVVKLDALFHIDLVPGLLRLPLAERPSSLPSSSRVLRGVMNGAARTASISRRTSGSSNAR